MAQRRVNVKAVGIILLILVGIMGSITIAKIFLLHRDPKKYIALAERYLKEGNLQEAAVNYKLAIEADPRNVESHVKYGDIAHRLVRTDESYANQARREWDTVLTIDPTNKDALERMMSLEVETLEFNPDPQFFTRLHELAEKILKLPLDGGKDADEVRRNAELKARATAYLHISTIAGWLKGITQPDEVIRDNADAMEKLVQDDVDDSIKLGAKAHPINPDLPYFLGMTYVQQARELRARGEEKEAVKLERRAYSMFDKVISAQPKGAVVRLRFAQVLRRISDTTDDDMKDDRQEYIKKMHDILEDAQDFVKPDDLAYTEVNTEYADFLSRNKDMDGAERILRQVNKAKPDDQWARLRLAAVLHLDPAKYDEAIALLKLPVTDTGDGIVLQMRTRQAFERETLYVLAMQLIDAYSNNSDPAKRAVYAKEIDDCYQKFIDRFGVDQTSLRLKGLILLVKGGRNGAIEAIPELEKAKELAVQRDNKRVDWDLEFLLARAYFDSNQTGVAKQKLWEICHGVPQATPPRVLLARLLITDHEMDLAREVINELKRLSPGDPQVDRLERQLIANDTTARIQPGQIDKAYTGLPESNVQELRTKVGIAIAAQKIDEAVRLLEKLRGLNPADLDAVRTLTQIYASQKKMDLAKKVSAEALAKDPNNIALKILAAAVKDDQVEVARLTQEGIQSIKVPFDREMSFYEYFKAHNKLADALSHLDAAEKLDSESSRIMDIRYNNALVDSKWDVAEQYASRLGLKNADEAHGLIYKYRLSLARGDFKAAELTARDLIKSLPQFAQSWLCFGEVLKLEGKYEDAANKFQNALQKQTENFEAYRGLIECYFEMRKPEDAKRYIEAGLKVLPGNPWLTEQQIAYDLNYGDPMKALAPRQAAADANPDSLGAQLANGAALWQIAQFEASKNKLDDSKAHLESALKKLTTVKDRWPDERIAYAYLADIYVYKHDLTSAETILKAYADREAAKDLPDAYMMLADFYARASKFDVAEAEYSKSLARIKDKMSRGGIELYRKVAGFYTAQRKFDKAIETLQPVSADRGVQQQIVEAMMSDNKLTDAAQFLQKNLKSHPDDSQFLATLAYLLMTEKKIPEAITVLNHAIDVDPRNQVALYYRGMIRLKQGPAGLDDAIKDLTAARDISDDPNSTAGANSQIQTRVALAEALRAHGQTEDAVQEMSTCVSKQPGNKEIRVRLIELLGTLVPPRWNEVERLLAEVRKMKGGDTDPDWPRLAASMWTTRDNPDKALQSIREALQLAQGDLRRTLPLMQDYLNILDKAKKYRELLSQCDELLKNSDLVKTSWWIFEMRAVANSHLDGRRAEALTDYDKALEIAGSIRSDDATALIIQAIADTIGLDEAVIRCEREANKGDNHWKVILTYLYFSKKDYARAESTIEGVLALGDKLKPIEKKTALGVAGSIYMLTGEYRKALDVYQTILATNDDDTITVALNNLACIWADDLDTPDPAKALTYSSQAMDIMGKRGVTDGNIMDTHGWVLVCNDRVDEGITFLQAAVDRRPFMEGYYHLGVALLKKNLGIEAQQQLDRARKMLDERKNKGQPTDARLEARLNEALVKAKQMINASAGGHPNSTETTGTTEPVKP